MRYSDNHEIFFNFRFLVRERVRVQEEKRHSPFKENGAAF